MIIWISSYPKSGNTWLRSLLSSYLFSEDGKFTFKLLDKIRQFSSKDTTPDFAKASNYQEKIIENWIPCQTVINQDKKIHLFKTHNAICTINGNKFTDEFNTIAAVYLVRDPRNIITSISHHYELSLDEAFNFLTNKRKIIFPIDVSRSKKKNTEPDDFNFLGDWSNHYQSWKNINFCPVKIIKYEDFIANPQKIFISTLDFLSKFMKFTVDNKKINNAINSTSFDHLSEMEEKEGFEESATSTKTNKKIKFFNLGKKNNWKNLLNKTLIQKIESHFKSDMTELGYL